MNEQQEKLRPYLGQQVKLYLGAEAFNLSLQGELKELVGKGEYDKWIGIKHNETLLFFEIHWDRCTLEKIYDDENGVRIFVQEKKPDETR